jgi:hypothetical protein
VCTSMRIELYNILGTDTLRDRHTAQLVLTRLESVPHKTPVIIDFAKITFASRSFCHELLITLKERGNVRFENANNEVTQMMRLSLTKPTISQNVPVKMITLASKA